MPTLPRPPLFALLGAAIALAPAAAVSAAAPAVSNCQARNLRVDVVRTDVQIAIDESVDGDTIEIIGQCYPATGLTLGVDVTIVGRTTVAEGEAAIDGSDNVRILTIKDSPTVVIKNLILRNGQVTGGDADGSGGAIASTGTLTLTSVTLRDNMATLGGALYLDTGTVTIKGASRIFDNMGLAAGGAISSSSNQPTLVIAGTTNIHHNLGGNGGAIDAYDMTITIGGSAVLHDNAVASSGNGGAIYARGTVITLKDKAVIRNNFASFGGAISGENTGTKGVDLRLSRIVLQDSARITRNSSDVLGSAILAEGRISILDKAVVSNNTNTFEGGGAVELSGHNGEKASITMKADARIKGNTNAKKGAGLVVWTGCGTVPTVTGVTGRVVSNTPKNVKLRSSTEGC